MMTSTILKFILKSKSDGSWFPLNKERIIVGSESNCDIVLQHEEISPYHAFIYVVDDDVVFIKNLHSKNGVFVNGTRFEETYLHPGDVVSFGKLIFCFEASGETPLLMVEDEYCNIIFDDKEFVPLTDFPNFNLPGEYIELDQTLTPYNLSFKVNSSGIEVINYINGVMSDIRYLKLQDGDYYLSPDVDDVKAIPFSTINRAKLLTVKKGKLHFHSVEEITPSIPLSEFKGDRPLFLTRGHEQVSLRLVEKAVRWKRLPFMFREKDFYKQTSTIFSILFFPMLLLLFVSLPEIKIAEPEPVVVYKLIKEIPPVDKMSELAVTNPVSENENTGPKETDQNKEKVEFAKAETPQKSEVASKNSPSPKKMAQSKPITTTVTPASKSEMVPLANGTPISARSSDIPAPPKPYKFKSNTMNSLMSDSPQIAGVGSASSKNNDDKAFGAGTSDKGDLLSNSKMGVSKLQGGGGSTGSGEASYGARGLASKKGFDSAYLEPNTVIQGSMDPELLRKILREYIPQFRHCYQKELARHSEKINGVIELNFTINQYGKSIKPDIRMKNAQFSSDGVNCMVGVLSVIDFPKPKGGGIVDVRQPLTFYAENSK